MGTAVQEPQQQLSEEEVLALIVVVLLSGQATATTAGALVPPLRALGIPFQPAVDAISLALPHFEPEPEVTGPASRWRRRTEVVRRAQYLVKAAQRLMRGGTLEAERRYLEQHLAAVRARQQAVSFVDAEARRFGPVLGWYAIRDGRTTAECRAAHGANFSAASPPVVGFPGTLHGGTCRCRPGPPHRTSRTVDEAVASALRRAHDDDTQPFAVELSNPLRRLRSVLSPPHPER